MYTTVFKWFSALKYSYLARCKATHGSLSACSAARVWSSTMLVCSVPRVRFQAKCHAWKQSSQKWGWLVDSNITLEALFQACKRSVQAGWREYSQLPFPVRIRAQVSHMRVKCMKWQHQKKGNGIVYNSIYTAPRANMWPVHTTLIFYHVLQNTAQQ